MTECLPGALRECIEAWKRTKLPIGPAFYSVQQNGKSLPTLVILHSRSDIQSKLDPRYSLFCMILEEVPPSKTIRDEMCLACATRGFNSFFRLLLHANVGKTQPHTIAGCRWQPAAYGEIEENLGNFETRSRHFSVSYNPKGMKVCWAAPDYSVKLRSGLQISRLFVAGGIQNVSQSDKSISDLMLII